MRRAQVREFVDRWGDRTDVVLFSPSIHNSAYFLNVFEHGESEHPGLSRVAAQLFARIDPAVELDKLVSDSRNTVHSNYFVAKPRFWRAWLAVNERMFAIAETPQDPLGAELRAPDHVSRRHDVHDEDIRHGADGDVDSVARPQLRCPSARSLRGRQAHLQAARGHRVRCAQDRLRRPGPGAVQGRVPDGAEPAPAAQSRRSASAPGCTGGGCARRSAPCASYWLAGER